MTNSLAGQQLGKYELFEEIGAGGMGQVYRAQHLMIGREAAIKVLRSKLSSDKEAVSRFFNEARSTTMINHPGIVDIFDFGFAEDGSAFIVMELLDGQSLGDILRKQPKLPENTICRYARQAAGALASAHALGIIHRDLKPDNLFIVPDPEVIGGERVKVLDFGIAKLSGDAAQNITKTATGAVLGSPLYMSPEQCEGSGSTTPLSDVYSLGCVIYQLAAGRPPFHGTGVGAIIAKHIYETALAPIELTPEISPGLNDLIMALMEKDPRRRPPGMSAVVSALDRLTGNVFVETSTPTNKYGTVEPQFGSARLAPTLARSDVPGAIEQTTHGSSSGQISGRSRSPHRSWTALAAGAVVAIASVVLVLVLLDKGGDEMPETAASAASEESPPAEATPEDTPARATAPSSNDIEITDSVVLEITSEPTGALVRDASRQLLGETPYKLTADKAEQAEDLIITQLGYEDSRLSLVPDRDRKEHVVLVALKQEPAPAPVAASSKRLEKAKKAKGSKNGSKSKTKTNTKPTATKKKKKKKKSGFGETIDPLED